MIAKCFPGLHIFNTVLIFTFWTYPFLDALTDIMSMYVLFQMYRSSGLTLYSYKHPYRNTPTVPNEDIDQGWIRLLHVPIDPHGFMFHRSCCRSVPRWGA
jgi:hypothetical protein